MYDYCIVGAGLYGSIFAYEMSKAGKRCLVVERRDHIGGNCYTKDWNGIQVHEYGAHIFRTSDHNIWEYMQQFTEFNHFINAPLANYHGKLYNMPFNMNTFHAMWGVNTPKEAKQIIAKQRKEVNGEPQNLEEQAISLVGRELYEVLVKEYTEKQWGRPCTELPASILRRLPVRYIYDNNYFRDPYQGIPKDGYTAIFEKLLANCDVKLGVDYDKERVKLEALAKKVLYTGAIDRYFDFCFGSLEYRSLRFEHERVEEENVQGVAVINYTDKTVPYTRTIEHKHFVFGTEPFTILTKEYPLEWKPGIEPYYPINDDKNQKRYHQYAQLAQENSNVIFGGRLGLYQYTDMQDTVKAALHLVDCEKNRDCF